MILKAPGRALFSLCATAALATGLVACNNAATQSNAVAPAPAAEVHPTVAEIAAEAAMEDGFSGDFGVVVIDGTGTYKAGTLTTTNAWSTIKVPIVVAAIDANPDLADSDLVEATLRWSDNGTAWTLWKTLGSTPEARAEAVEDILAATGDTSTKVKVAPDEPYGATQWSLHHQARFMSNLRCLDNADVVLDYMGDVIDEQRWGLGQFRDADFKGGWGPDDDGTYQARQMGIVPAKDGGDITIVLAANVESEAYREDAEDALTRAAKAMRPYVKQTEGRTCALSFTP